MKQMLKYKRILISLSIVLFFSLIIQFLRMNILMEWSKASNNFQPLETKEAVNIEIPNMKAQEQQYIIYYDKEDVSNKDIFDNIVKLLDYLKKDYIASDNIKKEDLTLDKTVIVAARTLDALGDITPIIDYLETGGKVIFAASLEKDGNFNYIQQKLGIYESGYLYHSSGIRAVPGVFLGGSLDLEGEWSKTSSLSVRLNEDCKVLAKAYDGNPLFWEVKVAQGKAIVFNNTFLEEKSAMGMFTTALAKAEEAFIYPVVNSKVMLLNNFPLSFMGNEAYMKKHYGRNAEGFIRDIWWPDMAKVASKYDIKYTSFFTDSFKETKEESSREKQVHSTNLSFIGREILRYGGELALSDYSSYETLRKYFQNYAFRAYSAPEDMPISEYNKLIEKNLRDLAVINGLYEEQDFAIDAKGFTHFPRASKGFSAEPEEYWNMLNTVLAFGVVSHSLDLREVLMVQEESKDWKMLGEEFDDFSKRIFQDYGWIRSMTLSQAGEELKKYEGIKPHIFKDKDKIEVFNDNFKGPISFLLRYEKDAKALKGCTLKKLESGFYIVHVTEPIFSIKLGG